MEKKRLSIYLTPRWYQKVFALSKRMNNSVSGTIAFLVRVGMEKVERSGLESVLEVQELQDKYWGD